MFENNQCEIYNLTDGEVTSELDLITCAVDLKTNQDSEFYFLIGHKAGHKIPATVEIFGSPIEKDIMKIAHLLDVFNITTPSIYVHGVIMEPKCLPISFSSKEFAYVIMHETSVTRFDSMLKVTTFIESNIDEVTSIDDFDIIIGTEIDFNVKEWDDVVKGVSEPMMHGLA